MFGNPKITQSRDDLIGDIDIVDRANTDPVQGTVVDTGCTDTHRLLLEPSQPGTEIFRVGLVAEGSHLDIEKVLVPGGDRCGIDRGLCLRPRGHGFGRKRHVETR